jgi:transposase
VRAQVGELVHQAPALHGLATARWRLEDLRTVVPALAAYTLAGLSQLLRRLRVRRKRGRLAVHSPDLAYERKLAWIGRGLALARAAPATVRLLYADEFSLYRQPTLAARYAAVGHEPLARLSHRSNTRQRYAGALDAVSGQVVWTTARKLGVRALQAFLRALRAAYPTEMLLLVWDNWPVHQHPDVLATAAALEIQLLWLPTYAPWTNPIEKLWRWLKQTLLHHHRLADGWAELLTAVAQFLDQFAHSSPALLRYVGLLPN